MRNTTKNWKLQQICIKKSFRKGKVDVITSREAFSCKSPGRPVGPVPSGLGGGPPGFSTDFRKETRGLTEGDFFQRGTLFRKAEDRSSGVETSVDLPSTIFSPSCTPFVISPTIFVNDNRRTWGPVIVEILNLSLVECWVYPTSHYTRGPKGPRKFKMHRRPTCNLECFMVSLILHQAHLKELGRTQNQETTTL